MPKVTPFRSIRPVPELAGRIAALPYDVYNREEALKEVQKEPLSFLKIDRAETQFPAGTDMYAPEVYAKAREILDNMILDGSFIMENMPCYYIYELIMDGRSQTGIAACSSVEDYQNNLIKKHENTREEKELDRIRHVDVTNAHTGPVFLAYRSCQMINEIVNTAKLQPLLYDFVSADGVSHRVWRISDASVISRLEALFAQIPCTYIADGHHRCASAVSVGQKRRAEAADFTGREEYNRFLSVLFPDDQLRIMPYNRVVKDLNGLSPESFIEAVRKAGFSVECKGKEQVAPAKKGTFGMYLAGNWDLLTAGEALRSAHVCHLHRGASFRCRRRTPYASQIHLV